jgi:two-component system, OmpR family, sensor kinase
MRSIKFELTIYLSLGIVLIIGLLSFLSYHSAEDELGELYDANMEHLAAAMIENYAGHAATEQNFISGLRKSKLHGEQDYLIQVKQNNQLIYQSHQGDFAAKTDKSGLFTEWVAHKRWRIFILKQDGLTGVVAQDYQLRQHTIRDVAIKLIIPQLLVVPFLIIVTLMIIQKTFKPLTVMSEEMARRNVEDLNLFNENNQPKELIPIIRSLNVWMRNVNAFITLRKRFTSDAAHELRTPVTALRLQLSSLSNANQKELQDRLPRVFDSLTRMERLVAQLLTLSKVEPDARPGSVGNIDLNALIVRVLNDLRSIYMEKRLDVGMTYSDNVNISGIADEIEILLNNLLVNAINYSPEGGLINIQIRSHHHAIEIEIEDSGPGINPDDMNKVFERFYRSQSDKVPGSGLGLSIAQEIAQKHNAEIMLINKQPESTGLIVKVIFNKALESNLDL